MEIKSGYAPVNGAKLFYEVAGEGQPMILLHAGVADCRMWDDQFNAFAQRYRVIRYDLRGFGRSAMPPGTFCNYADVTGLLDYFRVDQAVVVGISFGGKIALDFALAQPSRVTALVLGAPSVGGTKPSEQLIQLWRDEDAAVERGDWETAVEINLRAWVDGPHRQPAEVDPAVRQKVSQMQREIFQIAIPDDVEEIPLEPAANGRLTEIKAPTLVMVGALDLPEKVAQAAWLADEIPSARQAVIPDVAHMLNMEAPAKFNQLVLDFLTHDLPTDNR